MSTSILNYFDYDVCKFLCPADTKELFGKIVKSEAMIPKLSSEVVIDEDSVLNVLGTGEQNEILIIGNLTTDDTSIPILLKVGDMVINGVEHRSGMRYTVNEHNNKLCFISLILYLSAAIDSTNYYFEWKINNKHSHYHKSVQQINSVLNKINKSNKIIFGDSDSRPLQPLILFSELSVLNTTTFVPLKSDETLGCSGMRLSIDPLMQLSVKFGTGDTSKDDKIILCVPRTH